MVTKIGFSDLCSQGFPFYGGVVSYKIPVECDTEWDAIMKIPHYSAAVNIIEVDGERRAVVAYPPYMCDIGKLAPGAHTITINTYISRRNCFGDVHDPDEKLVWQGPSAWMQGDINWTYEYRFRRTGVVTCPCIYKKNK